MAWATEVDLESSDNEDDNRLLVCGTRAVVKRGGEWRVECATCGDFKGVFPNYEYAAASCVRSSDKRCYECGAQ